MITSRRRRLRIALLAIFAPWFARLFLDRLRAEGELRQYGAAVCLAHGVFATRQRVGVLILVARFEREAVILADSDIRAHVTEAQLAAVAAQMRALLARDRIVAACAAGLSGLGLLLQGIVTQDRRENELPNTVVAERSP